MNFTFHNSPHPSLILREGAKKFMKKILLQNQKIIKAFATIKDLYLMGPFTTTNQRITPLYPDLRAVFSRPKNLKIIAQEIIKFIKKNKIKFDFIVGGATAGIPIATAVGLLANKPGGYVRKEPKGGGTNKTVEGSFKKGSTAILIDDALGHGAGKIDFLKNIRNSGFKVEWLIVVASRGYKNPEYFKWFKKAKVNFVSLCDIKGIVNYAAERGLISEPARQLLAWYSEDALCWNRDPKKWQYFLNYKKQKNHQSVFGV